MITQPPLIIHEWIILCKFSLVIKWFSLFLHVGRSWVMNSGIVRGEDWDQAQWDYVIETNKSIWDRLVFVMAVIIHTDRIKNFRFLNMVGSHLYSYPVWDAVMHHFWRLPYIQ